MMWKGNKEDLLRLLQAHQDRFDLSYGFGPDYTNKHVRYEVSHEEVFRAIEGALSECATPAKVYAEERRLEAEDARKHEEEFVARWRDDPISRHYRDAGVRHDDFARRADDFDWVAEIGFGDNHGMFCGGDLGNCMDYEGRDIRIVQDDLYYDTEQNR